MEVLFMINMVNPSHKTEMIIRAHHLPKKWEESNEDIRALKSGNISPKEFSFEEKEAASEVPINEILPGLFLGNRSGAGRISGKFSPQAAEEKRQNLLDKGITTIICCTEDRQHYFSNEFTYYDLPLEDNDSGQLLDVVNQEVIDFIDKSLERGGVLIHCAAGMSRSASVMILYLSKKFPQLNYDQILNFLKSKRNCVEPNRHFESLLKKSISKEKYSKVT